MMITIDGPAGSGKSTTARLVANRLGFTYLDTGAMYRALTLLALQQNCDIENGASLARIAQKNTFEIQSTPERTRIWIDGNELTDQIRTLAVTNNVSAVSRHPAVRNEMVKLQRKIATSGKFVIEGRDIGSVVFPNARLKIFMKASVDARAQRRLKELQEKNVYTSFEKIKDEMAARDKYDSERETAPLMKPEGAIVLDTTKLTIDEQVEKIIEAFKNIEE
ncbi:MAG: (d)CMP kinase [bacterium]